MSIIPKVVASTRTALVGLVEGDLVFQTDLGKGFYEYINSTWFYVGEPVETRPITTSATLVAFVVFGLLGAALGAVFADVETAR